MFWHPSPNQEEKFIKILLNTHLWGDTSSEYISSFIKQTPLNWERLLKLIIYNRLEVIIAATLKNAPVKAGIPLSISTYLAKSEIAISYQSQCHFRKSIQILTKLNSITTDYVVLKTYLLTAANPKLAIKKPHDLDLLVPKHRFQQVASWLISQGYQYITYPQEQRLNHLPQTVVNHPSSQETFKTDHHTIELHTTIINTFPIHSGLGITQLQNEQLTKATIAQTQTLTIRKLKVTVFKPEYLLISLFLHAFYHHNCQLAINFYEIATLIRTHHHSINWNTLHRFARKHHMERNYFWFLSLLNAQHPDILPKVIAKKCLQYQRQLNLTQRLLYHYMQNDLFHHPPRPDPRAMQKEVTWAVINRKILPTIAHLNYDLVRRLLLKCTSMVRA